MLSIAAIKNQAGDGSQGGMPAYLKHSEYFLDKNGMEQSASAWWGKGAAALGLIGKAVDEKTMDKLADGFSPTGEKLRQNAGRKPEFKPTMDRDGKQRIDDKGRPMGVWKAERVGYDCTFSAPKSFSIVFAAADPELRDRLLKAHHDSCEKGLRMLELHAAETRRGKDGKDVIEVEGLLVSRHTHFAARSHDKAEGIQGSGVDMQIHSHCLVYNSVVADGKWSALEPKEMFAWKKAAGAVYRAELASILKNELGFGIEDDLRLDANGQVKDRFFKISGVPDALVRERSGRRQQIEAFMEDHPEASAQQATMATRGGKDEPGFGELVNSIWKDELNDYRERHPGTFPKNMRDLMNRPMTHEQETEHKREAKRTQQERDREILNELHETESVWSRKDLTRAIAERSAGKLDARGILSEVSSYLGRNNLTLILPEEVHADDKGQKLARRHRAVRFADPQVVEQEQKLVRDALSRKNETALHLNPAIVEKSIKEMENERGFKLNAEQREAVEFSCLHSGGVTCIQGWAGTGKTTSAEVTIKAHLASGFTVVGAATGWDAAKKLEAESGGVIDAHSIASLNVKLDKGTMKLDQKTLLIVDEAGMVGTPSLARLMAHANKAGSKTLLMGDPVQIQAVERGSPINLLINELGSASLKDIRRQHATADRDTAQQFYAAGGTELRSRGENQRAGDALMARLEKRGQLQGFETDEMAKKFLVQDYIQSPTPAREKLISAGTRADVNELNRMVRKAHQERGELGKDVPVDVRHPRTDVKQTIPLGVGERIRFGKKDETLGVVNGTRATITGLTPLKNGRVKIEATVESDIKSQEGRKLTFTNDAYAYLESGYAGTVHQSQGQGKLECYQYFSRSMSSRQVALVGFTRMKKSYTLYGGPDLFDRSIDAGVVTDRLQSNALSEGLHGKSTWQVINEKAARLEQAARARVEVERAAKHESTQPEPVAERTPTKDPAIVRAANGFRVVRDRMQDMLKERERDAARLAARERKQALERQEGGLTR